jgi:DNA-binding SARP family transcriptional activator
LMRQVPGNAQVQEHFVGFCLRRGRPDLAAKTLRALIEFLVDRPEQGGTTASVAALTQLMVLQPDELWAFEQLATILVREGREQEALRVYRQLAARRPDDAAVQARLHRLIDSVGAGTPATAAPE